MFQPSSESLSEPFIYLASQSPRRAQLLDQLGVKYRLLRPDPHEDSEALEVALAKEPPVDYVQRVTQLKLCAAAKRLIQRNKQDSLSEEFPLAPILCADTTVALGERIMGKPQNDSDAAQMLVSLSGQTHTVFTSICITLPSWSELHKMIAIVEEQVGQLPGQSLGEGSMKPYFLGALSTSLVEFETLTEPQIQAYIQSGEPTGKAGSYAVQGRAASFIKKIEGSYSGIMGLPLFECAQILRSLGYLVP